MFFYHHELVSVVVIAMFFRVNRPRDRMGILFWVGGGGGGANSSCSWQEMLETLAQT